MWWWKRLFTPESDRLGVTGCTSSTAQQHKIMSMWYRRSPTSTVISGSGTGVAAIGTISGSGGGKATLRPSIFGGVVVWAIAGPAADRDRTRKCWAAYPTFLSQLPVTMYGNYRNSSDINDFSRLARRPK